MKVSDYFEKKEKFELLIDEFFKYLCENELAIYNEFSFQHELGIFLRNKLRACCIDGNEYKIEFERNAEKHFQINYALIRSEKIKKEIDLVLYKKDHSSQYAIELKFPLYGKYPEEMFDFVKDIRFMQELVNQQKFQRTYCVTLVWAVGRGRPFFRGSQEGRYGADIYKYFRGNKEMLTGKILNPTRNHACSIDLKEKEYPFTWKTCYIINEKASSNRYKYRECKYYIIECK